VCATLGFADDKKTNLASTKNNNKKTENPKNVTIIITCALFFISYRQASIKQNIFLSLSSLPAVSLL